jgi:DNA-directed RNA polymerase specialized sigma24 family protein
MRLHMAGKTDSEIADLFKISAGTVAAQSHKARMKLRARLGSPTIGQWAGDAGADVPAAIPRWRRCG